MEYLTHYTYKRVISHKIIIIKSLGLDFIMHGMT